VLPNLEQCGLLKIRYKYLDEAASQDSDWQDTTLLKDLNTEDRIDFIQQILDEELKNPKPIINTPRELINSVLDGHNIDAANDL
jgi:hypothetical protein